MNDTVISLKFLNALRAEYLRQCKENNHPDFAPILCYQCNENIMIQNAEAIAMGKGYAITGCNKCLRSFCE